MPVVVEAVVHKGTKTMQKEELKTCLKCGEHYFGEHCVGCHSNQYAHYNADTSTKQKVLISLALLVIAGLVLLQNI